MPGAGTDSTQPWPEFGGPAVVLVEPQLGENIGAAARAMANFGLTDLRLVRPRDGWPNPQAVRSASGADRVLEGTRLYASVEAAIADCTFVLATTARLHGQMKPVISAEEAAQQMQPRIAGRETVAILFGPERTGLDGLLAQSRAGRADHGL
jgi:tRNA/rRNA methyltransferase